MKTELLELRGNEGDAAVISRASALLREGGVAAIPTETVYGLAARADCEAAVRAVFKAKGRPQDNPLISHVSSLEMWERCVEGVSEKAQRLAEAFWPGPLTIILKRSKYICEAVSCSLDTVAVRMPSHKAALAIISETGIPLAAPSANLSGRPSPTTAKHVLNDLEGRIPLIIDGGPCEVGVESTVISLSSDIPLILRPGIVSLEMIRRILPEAELSASVLREPQPSERVESPGMKYKHYSPEAEIVLLRGSLKAFIDYIRPFITAEVWALCFEGEESLIPLQCLCYGKKENAASQARELFAALRRLDELGAKKVYTRCPEMSGEALGVYNRLLRAAGFNIIDLEGMGEIEL
ncbi:MAG: L-threonylcarbamoyladenylate synthase [Oscillospiraceae bacterium]|nr:L-threonylcarbamoyladenylate synthase [Oscillospiraceae bacterium]